jgi:hypothetical protein
VALALPMSKATYLTSNIPAWCGPVDRLIHQPQTRRFVRHKVECRVHRHGFRFPEHKKFKVGSALFGVKSKKSHLGEKGVFVFPNSDPAARVVIVMPKLKERRNSKALTRQSMYYEGAIAADFLPELAPFISEENWATMIHSINTALTQAVPYESDVASYRGGVTQVLRNAMDACPNIFCIFHVHIFILMTTSGTHVERRLHHLEVRYTGLDPGALGTWVTPPN